MVSFLSEWWHGPRIRHLSSLWNLVCEAKCISWGCSAVSDLGQLFNWSQKQHPSTRRLEACVWERRQTRYLFSMACISLHFISTMQHITSIYCTDTIKLPASHITTEKRPSSPLQCHVLQRSLPLAWKCNRMLPHVKRSHPEWHPPQSVTVTQNGIHHHLVDVQRLPVPISWARSTCH